MNTAKFIEILRITLPVFAMLALGNVLSRTGKMTEGHQSFLNWIVYYISLPALIFVGMADQPFESLLRWDFITATLLSMLAVFLIFVALAFALRLPKSIAVIMIFTTYWSNCAYMGFPLAESAFGTEGFLMAAIYNAVSMPVFVAVSFVMIGLCSEKKQGVLKSLRDAFLNPIIIASIAGILYSWAAGALGFGGEGGGRHLPVAVDEALGICKIVLKNLGTMGLTLALIAVGGRLRFRSFRRNKLPMALSAIGKLALLPLITLFIMIALFPAASADRGIFGSAVLLSTMPTAVTGAVIASRFRLNEEFMSAELAVSMLGSVLAIPVWLYVVL